MRANPRSRWGALVVLFPMLLLGPVAAEAEEWRRGHAPIDSVDLARRTITLDEEDYVVPGTARIQNRSGTRVALSDLRVSIRPGQILVPENEVDFVRFEAIKKRQHWEIVELIVLDDPMD